MRFIDLSVVLALLVTVPAAAQAPRPQAPPISAAPELMPQAEASPTPTPTHDPWGEYMTRYHDVQKVPKAKAIRIDKRYARPNAVTPWKMEIVGEDAEFLYLKNLPIEDPHSPGYMSWKYHEETEAKLSLIKEIEEEYFILDPFAELVPPPFTDRLTFEERSAGLPTAGRWQMGFAVADLDKDGRADIVAPPQRLGKPEPAIFMGTDTGWRHWGEARWPQVRFDYGDVGVADFDGDGNSDIAIACHFLRNYILYGDGKGAFTRVVELPRVNPAVTSRALVVGDFDGDRRPDVAFLSELDLQIATNQQIAEGLLIVCLNTKSGWQAVDASGGRPNLYGDQLVAGDFDADGDLDLLASSHKNINRFFIFRNNGGGRLWEAVDMHEFPFRAYVKAVAAANLDRLPGDEAVLGFYQKIQSGSLAFPRNAIAIYSFLVGEQGMELKQRKIADIDAATNDYTCAAAGDLDGDGLLDLALGRQEGSVRIMLQTPEGAFLEERGDEIALGDAYPGSLAIVDLAPKGPRALIVMASDGEKSPGGIRCFIPRRRALDSGAKRQ